MGCYLEPSSDIPARNFDHKVIMQAYKLAIKCFCVALVSMWHHKGEFYAMVFKIILKYKNVGFQNLRKAQNLSTCNLNSL